MPDAHLTNLGSKGLGEPPIIPTAAAIANAIRDATGADVRSLPITREEMLRALREAEREEGRSPWSSSGLSSPTRRSTALGNGTTRSRAGPSSCRCSATGSSTADTLVDVRGVVPRGIRADVGAGTTLAELEVDPQIPAALREACRLAASPQLRTWARSAATCSRRPAAGTGGSSSRAASTAATAATRARARTASTRSSANDFCASAHPSDPAAALLALGATVRTDRRELPIAELYRLPTEDDRDDDAGAGRADPRARGTRSRDEHVPEGDGPAEVGVPARRRRSRAVGGRDADGARRGRPDPVAARNGERARRRDAAARHRVQGRGRTRAGRASRDRRRRSRLRSPFSCRRYGCSLLVAAAARARGLRRRGGSSAGDCGHGDASGFDRPAGATGACPVKGEPTELPPLDPAKTYTVTHEDELRDFTFTLDVEGLPVHDRLVRLPRRKKASSTARVPPDRPRLRDPGRRPDRHRHRRPRLHDRRRAAGDARSTRKASSRWRRRRAEPPGTSGSQFFVVTGADAGLPPDYALLGKVASGMDVVERIGKLGDPATEQPTRRSSIENDDRPPRRGRAPSCSRPARRPRFGSPKQRLLLSAVLRAGARSRGRRDRRRARRAPVDTARARSSTATSGSAVPGASLRCGLARARAEVEAAVVVLGDGPSTRPARRSTASSRRWRRSRRRKSIAATYGGVRQPPAPARAPLGRRARRGPPSDPGRARPVRRPRLSRRRRFCR